MFGVSEIRRVSVRAFVRAVDITGVEMVPAPKPAFKKQFGIRDDEIQRLSSTQPRVERNGAN